MIKYVSIFRLVLRCLLVAKKENLTGFLTGLIGPSKNLDPTGAGHATGAGRLDRFQSLGVSFLASLNTVVHCQCFKLCEMIYSLAVVRD